MLRKWGFTMNFIQYVKQVWKAKPIGGTPFTPDRFNHIEDGIKNNNDMISELNNNISNTDNEIKTYYISAPTELTFKKGTYWVFINKTQYSQSSIWTVDSSANSPVALANPSGEKMTKVLNDDNTMTIKWNNASYAAVSLLKVAVN